MLYWQGSSNPSMLTTGQLHYRELEREKIRNLALSRGDFDKAISLNEKAKQELRWWYEHVTLSCKLIQKPKVAFELHMMQVEKDGGHKWLYSYWG